uniref:EGF-like domain-containing protein n=1 Tax=Arundo donax TaxID=35708 RepID=A0A0A9CYA3_ARUDO
MTQGNGCYQHRCTNNSLEVAVDGIWKSCPQSGGSVQFPGFNGELICPVYHELCNTVPVPVSGQCPKSCNFNGDCIDGTCHCFPGFHGHDCSRSEYMLSTGNNSPDSYYHLFLGNFFNLASSLFLKRCYSRHRRGFNTHFCLLFL